ncbi:hypothetical protein [Ferroacidibacillus organovorans]|uniref:Uncharacterized protein n=1 Tax=Ferroacidibacillus organovorans TaxID=1765683 RepID=A0A117SX64_9BACL|nr:hypothetical protein [Ferroacidibacillus organovorans]KUO94925.1 hypothetical protein ATW55_13070 [Ferroacidibacillus organovorans]
MSNQKNHEVPVEGTAIDLVGESDIMPIGRGESTDLLTTVQVPPVLFNLNMITVEDLGPATLENYHVVLFVYF